MALLRGVRRRGLCEEPTFSPRTSKALYIALQTLADEVYHDTEAFGDGPQAPTVRPWVVQAWLVLGTGSPCSDQVNS